MGLYAGWSASAFICDVTRASAMPFSIFARWATMRQGLLHLVFKDRIFNFWYSTTAGILKRRKNDKFSMDDGRLSIGSELKNSRTQELRTQGLRTQGLRTQNSRTQGLRTQDSRTQEFWGIGFFRLFCGGIGGIVFSGEF